MRYETRHIKTSSQFSKSKHISRDWRTKMKKKEKCENIYGQGQGQAQAKGNEKKD